MPSFPRKSSKKTGIMAPHVVVLGAGASRQAFPNGDKNGLKLPLMYDFIETVGLGELLAIKNIIHKSRNFEDIYDEISHSSPDADFIEDLKVRVRDYFDKMKLPDEMTIYDKLILCLRKKDLIASFNWDPLLALTYKRNRDIKELPHMVFLHGNVAISVCLKCEVTGYFGTKCEKCGEYLEPTELLYPIKDKNYKDNKFIAKEWRVLESYLERAYSLTIFGYSAPKTDVAAIEIMKKIWMKNQIRKIAQISIIDTISSGELSERWKDFIVGSHYDVDDDFNNSYMTDYPRRSCQALFMATMRNQPLPTNKLPNLDKLDGLKEWISPLIEEERLHRKRNMGFSCLTCEQLREKQRRNSERDV